MNELAFGCNWSILLDYTSTVAVHKLTSFRVEQDENHTVESPKEGSVPRVGCVRLHLAIFPRAVPVLNAFLFFFAANDVVMKVCATTDGGLGSDLGPYGA